MYNAVLPKKNRLDLRRRRDHANIKILPLCRFPKRRGGNSSLRLEPLHRGGEYVEADDGVSFADEVGGHAEAHGSQADEADRRFGHFD